MGRFFFHVVEGAKLLTDEEGADLRDALEAKRLASGSFWRTLFGMARRRFLRRL
jgi:hypothetical protein